VLFRRGKRRRAFSVGLPARASVRFPQVLAQRKRKPASASNLRFLSLVPIHLEALVLLRQPRGHRVWACSQRRTRLHRQTAVVEASRPTTARRAAPSVNIASHGNERRSSDQQGLFTSKYFNNEK
jgi:hypothetical protein